MAAEKRSAASFKQFLASHSRRAMELEDQSECILRSLSPNVGER
jgi:hypothetical protein